MIMVKPISMALCVICSTAIFAAPLQAHEGGHGDGTGSTRTWSLTNGKHLHGTFIEANDRTVKLMTVAGEITTLEISELTQSQRLWVARKRQEINDLNATPKVKLVTQVRGPDESSNKQAPAIASSFKAFEKSVKVRWDNNFLFVESNGIPDHSMMVGIRAWQQQVPLPQSYFGDNAWRIPLHPVPAKNPATAKGRFLRGAIALAVNGIPIFNPLNNRGDDAYLSASWMSSVGIVDELMTITITSHRYISKRQSARGSRSLTRSTVIRSLAIRIPRLLTLRQWIG